MKHFIRSKDGPFAGWTNEQRKALMEQLIDCILEYVEHTCSSAVLLRDYEAVDREFRLHEEWGWPYEICARQVLYQMRDWKSPRYPDAPPIVVVYEHGDKHQGQFIQKLRDLGIDAQSIATGTKQQFLPFQAADIIAYEHTKAWEDGASGRAVVPQDLRESYRRLEMSPRRTWGFFDADKLRAHCLRLGIRRR